MTASIAVRSFSLPLRDPLGTAADRITERAGVAVRRREPEHVGVGEATPLPGWTEPLSVCHEQLSRIARRSDEAPPDPDNVGTGYPATRHAVHLAAADARARAEERPLASRLGTGAATDTVPIAALIGTADRAAAVDAAERAVRAGYPAVKCKVGAESVAADIERIRAVRRVVGTDTELRADANRAWSLSAAEDAFDGFAEAGVSFVEEPIADPTPERLDTFEGMSVDVALDETVCEPAFSLAPWIDVAGAVVLKPMAIGGLDRAMSLAERAHDAGLTVVISNTVDAVIARTAAVHLAAAVRSDVPAGLDTGARLAADLAADPIRFQDGRLRIPDKPGIGTLGPWSGQTAGGNHVPE